MSDYIVAADMGGSRIRMILSNRNADNIADKINPLKEGMTVDYDELVKSWAATAKK